MMGKRVNRFGFSRRIGSIKSSTSFNGSMSSTWLAKARNNGELKAHRDASGLLGTMTGRSIPNTILKPEKEVSSILQILLQRVTSNFMIDSPIILQIIQSSYEIFDKSEIKCLLFPEWDGRDENTAIQAEKEEE